MKKILFVMISVFIFSLAVKAEVLGGTHTQPPTNSMFSLLSEDSCTSIGDVFEDMKCGEVDTTFGSLGMAKEIIGLNLYLNPQLVTRNYVVSNNDCACDGDVLEVKEASIGGEWFGKGGPRDTPPVEWVTCDELNQIVNNVISYHQSYSIPYEDDLIKHGLPDYVAANEEAVGREMRIYKSELSTKAGSKYPWAYGNMICCADASNTLPEGKAVLEKGEFKLTINAEPKCIFYLEKVRYDYPGGGAFYYTERLRDVYLYRILVPTNNELALENWVNDVQLTTITGELTLSVIDRKEKPALSIVQASAYPEEAKAGETRYIKLMIKNEGNGVALFDDIKLNSDSNVLSKPEIISPGETGEVMLISKLVKKVKATLEYRAEKLGCLSEKEFEEESSLPEIVVIGACDTDSDCDGDVCCDDYCRPKDEGFCDDVDGDGVPDTWVKFTD